MPEISILLDSNIDNLKDVFGKVPTSFDQLKQVAGAANARWSALDNKPDRHVNFHDVSCHGFRDTWWLINAHVEA